MKKASFSLYFNNGEIWCEHLDSLCDKLSLVRAKLDADMNTLRRPSTSGYIVVITDETQLDRETMQYILQQLCSLKRPIIKVAFVGLSAEMKKIIKKNKRSLGFACECIDDLEAAKQWLL